MEICANCTKRRVDCKCRTEVHIRDGCGLCGKKTKHYHSANIWREFIDKVGRGMR